MIVSETNSTARRLLLGRLANARSRSDDLFALLPTESLYDRTIPQRHRFLFYLGHVEAFDWNLLHQRAFQLESFHPEFDRLFAFGIDPVGSGLPSDQPSDWPSPSVVREYVHKTRRILDNSLLDENRTRSISAPKPAMENEDSLATLLNVAIEHRLMHVETLTYMLHRLPLERKLPQRIAANVISPSLMTPPVHPRMLEIPAGAANLGAARSGTTFGWDNEYEAHLEFVPRFAIDECMVTNRQYLEFVNAGGYETREYWTRDDSNQDDWKWITGSGVTHPEFWVKTWDRWFWRAMFETIPLPLDWPVFVSHAEASAFARWSGKSLPTEQEWHRAAYGSQQENESSHPNSYQNSYTWGNGAPSSTLGNFDFHRWDPVPVNAFPEGRSALGVRGMLGNGWEWTSTPFAPFPGFRPFSFYPGYSADFFDGKHYVMKGGSPRTDACLLRPAFRNWFQVHYPYVYAGFRCVSR